VHHSYHRCTTVVVLSREQHRCGVVIRVYVCPRLLLFVDESHVVKDRGREWEYSSDCIDWKAQIGRSEVAKESVVIERRIFVVN
jgi:hypothetical protein